MDAWGVSIVDIEPPGVPGGGRGGYLFCLDVVLELASVRGLVSMFLFSLFGSTLFSLQSCAFLRGQGPQPPAIGIPIGGFPTSLRSRIRLAPVRPIEQVKPLWSRDLTRHLHARSCGLGLQLHHMAQPRLSTSTSTISTDMSGLEPLAALGLVCNVFQAISFTSEVCKAAKAFYDGGVVDPALARASQSLMDVFADIEASTTSRPLTRAEQEAVDIARGCKEVTASLMAEVDKSTAGTGAGKASLRKSFVAGFKSAIHSRSRRVERLEKRLAAHQRALETRLLLNLWYVGIRYIHFEGQS